MDPSQDNTQPNQGLDLSAVRSKNLPHEEKTGGPGQSAGGPADPNAVPVPALAFDVDEASFNDV
ncbi:MAG: tetratricopeptide repeat protein, partial [Brevibacterium aurantiacum]